MSTPESAAPLTLPPSFPAGEYTPFGYLDNPWHSMVLNRSGVIRSVPPLGFGYWRRTFRGTYGNGARAPVNYLSLLELGLACENLRLVTPADFARQNVQLVSRYHSQHLFSYDFEHDGLRYAIQYFLPRENTLACRVELHNAAARARTVHLHAAHVYGLWEQRWWGSDGLGMRYFADDDAALTAIWAYGDYFALAADLPSVAHKATAGRRQWHDWARANDLDSQDTATIRGPGPLHTVMSYAIDVPARGFTAATVYLCRAVNEPWALRELHVARGEARRELERLLDDDEHFWSRCPQLDGDWPVTWKHGWVYDWETLRMNVRRPLGIFRRPWDAMQIHSPRSVLGEAAVDMLALSYALPELAQQVLLGTFADGPTPNAPCCREDGSMNMIAADGDACGTAPSWCFPFHVLRTLAALRPDEDWLAELYPHLKSYLEWWLTHRADAHGWLHCHCDWESGQDGSKRFPEAEGGNADMVRTIDVEAGMAEALALMAQLATRLGLPDEGRHWEACASRRIREVRAMFVDGWFRDFDTRTEQPFLTPDLDIMMLAPLTCGIATPEQIEVVRPRFDAFRQHPTPYLEWPSFLLVYTEAAWTAGLHLLAGEVTADIAERIYPRTDARRLSFVDTADPYTYRIPGVANEYWPVSTEIEPGGEAYGWGATLPLHVVRDLVGFRETEDWDALAFYLTPALPQRLLHPGATYTLRGLHFRDLELTIRYDVQADGRLQVQLRFGDTDERHATVQPRGESAVLAEATAKSASLAFSAVNGQTYVVRFADE
jgi:hypothetical protein